MLTADDCDDSDASLNPYDADADGITSCDGDCDDNDPNIYPWDRDGDGNDEGCGWSMSAGEAHNCGVTSSGNVECWGDDGYGQSTPPSGTFQIVSAGGYHTCGVTSTGSVECWGAGGTNTDTWPEHGQSTAPSSTFQSVSAGGLHTCGVTSGGVECWGRDNYGQVSHAP